MQIFCSAARAKVPLDKKVNIYLCGPTVYDDAHLGHARSAVAFDLLRRCLLASGCEVKFARNYTDIDDKLINKSAQTNQSIEQIAAKYIKRYEEDMNALGVLVPDFTPKATEYIPQMISFVQKLLDLGAAYVAEDGVYLDSSKDAAYLSLSRKDLSAAQSRLSTEQNKRSANDFVLWKFDANYYDAPFGAGRPGWHTECVCMILELFGGCVDIHCGGADLFFPHHENEACQCRLAQGYELAKVWCHNGFVRINEEKMSKSLSNCFFVRDALKRFAPEALRLYLSSVHYRADFNYSEDDLRACKARLDRLYRLFKQRGVQPKAASSEDFKIAKDSPLGKALLEHLLDDLNISSALAVFDEWLAAAAKKAPNEADYAAIRAILGLGADEQYFALPASLSERVNAAISERAAAKAAKDYARADAIRNELAELGVALLDGPNGCEAEYIGDRSAQ